MIKQEIDNFVQRVHVLPHLVPLLPSEPLFIQLFSPSNSWSFSLGENVLTNVKEQNFKITINGTEEVFYHLMKGKEHLQKLLRRKEIEVRGAFRSVLLLESLLLLASVK